MKNTIITQSINLRLITVLLALFVVTGMKANRVVLPESKAHVHTPGTPQQIYDADPTCTQAGSYRLVVYCTTCGAEISSETYTLGPLGHDFTVIGEVYATCTESGMRQLHCSRCGEEFAQTTEPPLGHDYIVKGETYATCTESGKRQLYCSRCGEECTVETNPPLGHDYIVKGETYATCTESGKRQLHCSRCGEERTVETNPALGHLPGEPVVENIVTSSDVGIGSRDIVVYFMRCGLELSRETIPITTSVDAVKTDDNEKAVYAITGQRLVRPRKGVNIINGKKVVIK